MTKYYTLEIKRPLIELEINQGECSQCWNKKKILVYRKPIEAIIQGEKIELGKKILLCLECLCLIWKAVSKGGEK
ncbi:hypothetical protein [endosymbiont GvMRE of Glomus versiforme]|uniref:hypothetical protein n=1 Tax=endosymbiont GvMRE of Glomus versiforme TaxID=2039283 RepID=UPI000EE1814A|nr:hypothetical protein [endosymbiont GvMRE of Glomus versiforme]RHZ36724.1 hypothetical protein GvMRE_I2g413 [endosymbiont GvMRE of Glomus versiforme]RHZ36743.1 hypothetical protein GvMRE_I2g564 [endosymbiont GvMRE of Glomus versiforme]RHZ37538.1 hypothetical protein GvMRE_I1g718 [endosymbiont GvMRE of Glomus versiforme]